MQGSRTALRQPAPRADDGSRHALVVITDDCTRQTVTGQLRDAAFRVTAVASFELVEILSDRQRAFDLLVTAQSMGEMTQFGLPQLARAIDPDLPILLLDRDTARRRRRPGRDLRDHPLAAPRAPAAPPALGSASRQHVTPSLSPSGRGRRVVTPPYRT